MNNFITYLLGMISIVAIIIAIISFCIWTYGVYISFVAHPITGIIAFIVEPIPLIIGGADLFFDCNIAELFTERFIR